MSRSYYNNWRPFAIDSTCCLVLLLFGSFDWKNRRLSSRPSDHKKTTWWMPPYDISLSLAEVKRFRIDHNRTVEYPPTPATVTLCPLLSPIVHRFWARACAFWGLSDHQFHPGLTMQIRARYHLLLAFTNSFWLEYFQSINGLRLAYYFAPSIPRLSFVVSPYFFSLSSSFWLDRFPRVPRNAYH